MVMSQHPKLKRDYIDHKRVGSYGGVVALRQALAEETRRTMGVGTGRLCPTQTGENSTQETIRCRGRSEPAVAGRSRRHVETKEERRRHHISVDGDRRLFEVGLVRPAKEQISVVDGGGV